MHVDTNRAHRSEWQNKRRPGHTVFHRSVGGRVCLILLLGRQEGNAGALAAFASIVDWRAAIGVLASGTRSSKGKTRDEENCREQSRDKKSKGHITTASSSTLCQAAGPTYRRLGTGAELEQRAHRIGSAADGGVMKGRPAVAVGVEDGSVPCAVNQFDGPLGILAGGAGRGGRKDMDG